MDFRILGSLEVWDGERQLDLGGQKRRAVLAFLLLHANELVTVDRLVDQLWGEKAPQNAAGALHTHVSRLRKELGPEVLATGYVLRVEPGSLDLERFERLVAEAESLPARERAKTLREALGLWRGAPLEDLAFEPALAADIAWLEELRLSVLETRIDADLETGNHAGLVAELEALIAQQPLRERLRGQLILALYRDGRQAEALEAYRETRHVLMDELGLEPSPDLRELERAILQQDPALRRSAVPAGTAVVAESGVQAGRRRHILIAATLALLLAGVGIAASDVLTTHTTHAAARPPITVVKVVTDNSGEQRRTYTTTTIEKSTNKKSSNKKSTTTHATNKPSSGKKTTTTTTPPARSTRHGRSSKKVTKGLKPAPVRVADSFSGSTLDNSIWTTWSNGSGSNYTQANGQAVFSIAGDVTYDPQWNNVGTDIGTQCKFPGAFDARVHFSLPQWPTGNGADIELDALGDNGAVDTITRSTTTQFDGYTIWPVPFGDPGATSIPDTSGRLRIARSHGDLQTYIWHRGHWKELGGQLLDHGEIWLAIGIGTDPSNWQQKDVSAAFDNFKVTAPNVC